MFCIISSVPTTCSELLLYKLQENRIALVSIKYIYTLLSFNFIIIVSFSNCISDSLNVQIQKLWTKPIPSFSFVSCASWSWCYFGAAFYLCFKTLTLCSISTTICICTLTWALPLCLEAFYKLPFLKNMALFSWDMAYWLCLWSTLTLQ